MTPPIRTEIEELQLRGVRFRHHGIYDRYGQPLIECKPDWSRDVARGMPCPPRWHVRGLPGSYGSLEEAAEAILCPDMPAGGNVATMAVEAQNG